MSIIISLIMYKIECYVIEKHCDKLTKLMKIGMLISNIVINAVIINKYGFDIYSIKWITFSFILFVIGIIDLCTLNVYRSMIIVGITLGGIFCFIISLYKGISIFDNIFGGALGYSIFFIIEIISKGIGNGDKDIALLYGIFLGSQKILLSIYISFIIGGIVSVILIVLKMKNRKDEMAYTPYLGIGCILSVVFGDSLISEYIHYLTI